MAMLWVIKSKRIQHGYEYIVKHFALTKSLSDKILKQKQMMSMSNPKLSLVNRSVNIK